MTMAAALSKGAWLLRVLTLAALLTYAYAHGVSHRRSTQSALAALYNSAGGAHTHLTRR